MNDRAPDSRKGSTEHERRRGKYARRFGTVALLAATPVAPAAVITSFHAPPDSSPLDVIQATGRQLGSIYNDRTAANLCPVAPSDISVLTDTERWLTPTDQREDVVAYGESLGLSFAEATAINSYSAAIKDATSVNQIVQLLNSVSTEQLDVAIKARDLQRRPEASPDLETFKDSSMTFLQIMSLIPKELFEKSGLTSVVIAPFAAETATDTFFNTGQFDSTYKSITIDYNWLAAPSTLMHEISHSIHYSSCNGFPLNDKAIQDRNPANEPYITPGDSLSDDYNHNVWPRGYARASVQEDVAETTTALLLHTVPIEIGSTTRPLTAKMSIIADRINDIAPGTVDYFKLAGPYIRSITPSE